MALRPDRESYAWQRPRKRSRKARCRATLEVLCEVSNLKMCQVKGRQEGKVEDSQLRFLYLERNNLRTRLLWGFLQCCIGTVDWLIALFYERAHIFESFVTHFFLFGEVDHCHCAMLLVREV